MADGATPPRPIGPAERIDAIDVLRGMALLGVVAINVVTIFRVSIFEQFLFPKPPGYSPIDSAVETILMLAVDLKAFALFSLLFGAGLAIQFERLAKSERRTSLLVRRLVVLLAFGLIHLCLIWNGDILTEYALAGFIVLPFLFGPRWLLAVAALASLGLYLAMQVFPPPGLWPGTAALAQDVVGGASHLSDGRLPRRAGVPAPRNSPYRFPARLYLSAHDRVVSSRRVRLAHRHSAKPATPSAVLDRRRLYRPWRGIDPLPCRRLDRGRPDPRPGRTSRHHPAGAGLWRCHHRHRQSRERKEAAGLGRAARTHGLHQLPRAIRHPWLDLLRLWSRPVRPPRRRPARWPSALPSTSDRCCSARGGCAATATARSNGCGAR